MDDAAELYLYQTQTRQEKADRKPLELARANNLSSNTNKRRKYVEDEEFRNAILAHNEHWRIEKAAKQKMPALACVSFIKNFY